MLEDIFTLVPSLKKFFLKKDNTIEKFGPKIAKCVNKKKTLETTQFGFFDIQTKLSAFS